MIRVTLAIVAAFNFYAAYLFFFTPEVISLWYKLPPVDNVHRFLTMIIGALLSVFGLGALLAFFRPLKYATIIIMLLLMHFMIFIIDVMVLSRGQMPWQSLMPEMVYFLIVSTALVRFYPLKKKQKVDEAPQEPVEESKENKEGEESNE